MRHTFVALILSILCGCSRTSLTAEDVFQATSPSVVTILSTCPPPVSSGMQGSGVALSRNVLVTNAHVVVAGCTVSVFKASGESSQGFVAYASQQQDLAIVTTTLSLQPAKVAWLPPPIGATIYAIGSPYGLTQTLSTGLISGIRETLVGPLLQINAPIAHGSSGGGLFDDHARLVGITTLGMTEGALNFAIPVRELRRLPPLLINGESFSALLDSLESTYPFEHGDLWRSVTATALRLCKSIATRLPTMNELWELAKSGIAIVLGSFFALAYFVVLLGLSADSDQQRQVRNWRLLVFAIGTCATYYFVSLPYLSSIEAPPPIAARGLTSLLSG